MRVGVITFPGTHGDRDCVETFRDVFKWPTIILNEHVDKLPDLDLIILPGGFSYGDYLRPGAIAARSALIGEVKNHAERGGKVLGICNGFQMLTEAGLLCGALSTNQSETFVNKTVWVRNTDGDVYRLPIAHRTGRFVATNTTLTKLENNDQIVLRYCTAEGETDITANPNGSRHHIAGICNRDRNVIGIMPHPERATSQIVGNFDGILFLQWLTQSW